MEMDSEVEKLHSRADSVFVKFEEGGGTDYIDQAITLDREALALCPPSHPKRCLSLLRLEDHLYNRFYQLGEMDSIQEAITLAREAVELCPPGHPDRRKSLTSLAVDLSARYHRLGEIANLLEAVALDQEALDLCPQGHPDRALALSNFAARLATRYQRLGGIADLNEAIVLGLEALALRPPGHPDRSMPLNNLAIYFGERYKQMGDMADINEAIALGREVLVLRPPGHPLRSSSLSNVAMYFHHRYKQMGGMEDLNEAITLGKEALDLRMPGHPDRSSSLNNVANYLRERYKQLGGMADLNEAIIRGREALELCPPGHPNRSMSLNNIAVYFHERYQRSGGIEDLDDAIILGREALDLRPPGHPDRPMSLNNVANFFHERYKLLGGMEDLDESIVIGQEALGLCLAGHPLRSSSLSNVSKYFYERYKQLGGTADLNEAIVRGQEALNLRQPGNPFRSTSLNNLSLYFHEQYEQSGAMEDLNQAITLAREAVELCPIGHPYRSELIVNLADYLRSRFAQSNQLKDKEDLFNLYVTLAHIPQSVSSSDLLAAKAWVNVAEDFYHPTMLLAYKISLQSLVNHLATLPTLPQHLPIIRNLASTLAVDSFSACLRNRCPANAVELLEQGRSIFWNQVNRLRSPLVDVVASGSAGKSLADQFTRVSSQIHDAIHSPCADQYDRLCRLNFDLERIITDIRKLPGLERFLLPSLFSDLQRAVSDGPVIIVNASKYSCDALVVFADRDPVHIPIHVTKAHVQDLAFEVQTLTHHAKRMDVSRDLGYLLRELWNEIVSPIVEFLQTAVPPHSRIWWCPTAEFSVLPLHAAGPYRNGQRNLSHLYISSYTPTLTALIRARRYGSSNPASAMNAKRFLAVGQANANGESELVSVGSELAIISQRIKDLTMLTCIGGPESSISRVSEELKKNEWVHIACHGVPNRKAPFESAFALHDGHFTIEHIMQCDLGNAQFAYLSACHTTVGDEESPDEVIHLASAMQFAGFRSVIGTMWAVDDAHTNKITSRFYEYMVDESGCLDHTRAAFALNKTMTEVDIPMDQRILYVHIGA